MHDSTPQDSPACRDTLDELVALWDSIQEVSPGSGGMSATLKDFTSVHEDAQVIEDTSQAFDRLMGFHERKQAVLGLFERVTDTRAFQGSFIGAAVLGTAGLVYGMTQGSLPSPPPHYDTLGESFQNAPLSTSFVTTTGVASVGALLHELVDRGYARFAGLSDALARVADGATPNADSLKDRLSETERETYREILELGHKAAAHQDDAIRHRFLDRLHETMTTVVSNLEGTPQAGMIQETLHSLRDTLTGSAPNADRSFEQASLDHYLSTSSAPSL